ncbi:50S ribosomal protein L16 [bacterium]|nr:50S ribosomal protein L16 [bacterium]
MLQPKKTKYQKMQKGRTKGKETRATELTFGTIGLKSLGSHWIKSSQIEAARKVLLRYFKGKGKIWIRIFPQKSITFKGNEVGMGGGKGSVVGYVYPIKPGRIIFEVDGVPEELAESAFKEAGTKLPVKTKVIKAG